MTAAHEVGTLSDAIVSLPHTTDYLWANCGRTFVVFMTGRFQMPPACAHGQVVCLWITQGDRHHGIKPIPHVTVHLSTHLYATTTRGISSIGESMVSGDSCPAGQVRVAIVAIRVIGLPSTAISGVIVRNRPQLPDRAYWHSVQPVYTKGRYKPESPQPIRLTSLTGTRNIVTMAKIRSKIQYIYIYIYIL